MAENFRFLRCLGIINADFQQKAVQLRLGQRIRSLKFNRVLRGEHGEEIGKWISLSIESYLSLFHRLQQRRLRPGWSAVNFIHKQQVAENRPAVKRKCPRLW